MMASAIRDPLYQAALTVANQDVLGIGQWCLRCHSPTSYVQGHGLPTDGSALDAVDRAGVSCEACHRTRTDAGLIGNAQLTFEPSFTVFGPYTHVDSPAHTGVQDPAVSQSSLCGQCHEVRNPVLGRAGTQRPFPLDNHLLGVAALRVFDRRGREDLSGLSHGAGDRGPSGGEAGAGAAHAQPARLRGRERLGAGCGPGRRGAG
jgi:hypothetical protein